MSLSVVQIWVHISSLFFNLGMIYLTVHYFCLCYIIASTCRPLWVTVPSTKPPSPGTAVVLLCIQTQCFLLPSLSVACQMCHNTSFFPYCFFLTIWLRDNTYAWGIVLLNSCCNHSWICVFMYINGKGLCNLVILLKSRLSLLTLVVGTRLSFSCALHVKITISLALKL